MPAKIRLQRHGKKMGAFYHIVIADNRSPRDGKFIEKIGTYNPNTNPATIDLSFDKALTWLKTGAQPTDTVRAILSYEGVLYRNHLDRGVLKGAFTEDDANKKFESWKKEKQEKIQKKIEQVSSEHVNQLKSRIKSEEEVSKKREQDILAKASALAEEAKRLAEKKEADEQAAAAAIEKAETEDEVTAEENVETKADAPAEADAAPAEVSSESVESAEVEEQTETPVKEEEPEKGDAKAAVAQNKDSSKVAEESPKVAEESATEKAAPSVEATSESGERKSGSNEEPSNSDKGDEEKKENTEEENQSDSAPKAEA